MKPLYILDGYGLIFRSYFAFIRAPRRAPDGRNVSAVFGFFRTLISLFKEYGPENFVVALDSVEPTFRDKLFPEYKGTRDSTPEELILQFPIIEHAIFSFGLPAVRINGFEADDLIADLVSKCKSEGRACYIISSDKDLMQLVEDNIFMLRPTTKEGLVLIDREGVYSDKGVWPEQIVDFLSMIGDASDNVPGIKGIGEKTASKLLNEFLTLDGIYQALDEGKNIQKGVAQKLIDGREMAYFSRKLVTLVNQTGINQEPFEFHIRDLKVNALAEILLPLGMKNIVDNLSSILKQNIDQSIVEFQSSAGVLGFSGNSKGVTLLGSNPQGELFEVMPESHLDLVKNEEKEGQTLNKLSDTPGGISNDRITDLAEKLAKVSKEYRLITNQVELDKCLQEMETAKCFAIDTETTGLDPMTAEVIGISLCSVPGIAYYLPIFGPNGPVLDKEVTINAMKKLLHKSEVKIIGQNIKYDMKVLRRWGIEINPYFDTMIAAWVLESSSNKFNMDDLAQLYLGYETIHYKDVFKNAGLDKSDTFDKVPLEAALNYAAEDADITFRLFKLFEKILIERNLTKLFFDLEMPLLPILADMEFQGITIDSHALEDFSKELDEKIKDTEQDIYTLVGHEFNIKSTKQLQDVLFLERKLTPTKKTKTGYSTDTSVLEELASEDPVPEKILQFRGLSKLKSTYVDTLPTLVNKTTGRIHTTFHQHGTATGRMSSKDPNLQNIPIKDEEGRKIRKAFLAPTGYQFVSADYSQIELVVLAHFAGDRGLINAFEKGLDVHRATGSLIFGINPEEVTLDQRRIAKTINFGVMYGMSAYRLSRELGISRKDASNFIDAYFRTYTGIHRFLIDQAETAEKYGGVYTLAGRFRRIPEIYTSNKTERAAAERIAVNTPIQGSAADIVKTAMVKVQNKLSLGNYKSKMILQVHDEIILECPDNEVESVKQVLQQEMTSAISLRVPLQVSIESGTRWGDMH